VTLPIAYVLCLFVLGLGLFAWDYLSVDIVALLLLLALTVPGILTPSEALGGFGNDTLIVLISLFILTAGVVRTGVVERLGLRLATFGGKGSGMIRILLIAVTTVSAFFSNTVTTAVFLPIGIGAARRASMPISKVLMPIAFASILASPITLIATSTNLLVSGLLPRYGLERIGFFEMTPVGFPIMIVGLLYLLLLAPKLIPDRAAGEMTQRYDLRKYLTEVVVMPGSRLAEKTIGESRLGDALNLGVVGILREDQRILAPGRTTKLREGDVLIIEGKAEDILSVKDAAGIEINPDVLLSDPDLESDDVRMVEAMVLPRSNLLGSTLRESDFRERTGLTVLAVHSAGGQEFAHKISHKRLRVSDVLLLQGREEDLQRIDPEDLLLLEDVSAHHPRRRKARTAVSIFVASVALGALGLLPIAIAFLGGAVALVLTRCITTEEAYEAVDWRMMVLIGSMIAFGVAMEKTGTATLLAGQIAAHASDWGTLGVMAGFFVLTVFLTQPMSNQAAALVVLPVAIQVAQQIGVNPRMLVMVVAFAASCSFLTPLEPSCVLVYGPGRYRFFDFSRVGAVLTLIVFLASMLLIPVFWPPSG
jgi:di/tricarboxylate transporter